MKMVRDPRLVAQVLELRHEADIYHHLRKNDCADVVPTFFGFSESAGVHLLCLEFEGEDFDDIGEENLLPSSSQLSMPSSASVRLEFCTETLLSET